MFCFGRFEMGEKVLETPSTKDRGEGPVVQGHGARDIKCPNRVSTTLTGGDTERETLDYHVLISQRTNGSRRFETTMVSIQMS